MTIKAYNLGYPANKITIKSPPLSALEDWTGDFGSGWFARNLPTKEVILERKKMFQKILPKGIGTILEFGSGWGVNLLAMQKLVPRLYSVEPNPIGRFYQDEYSIHSYPSINALPSIGDKFDLVFTCASLMHLKEDILRSTMYALSLKAGKYFLMLEYFARKQEMIDYRGKKDYLWKRDYGKLFLDYHAAETSWKIQDYGFLWSQEYKSFDDVHWWLFQRI